MLLRLGFRNKAAFAFANPEAFDSFMRTALVREALAAGVAEEA